MFLALFLVVVCDLVLSIKARESGRRRKAWGVSPRETLDEKLPKPVKRVTARPRLCAYVRFADALPSAGVTSATHPAVSSAPPSHQL